MFDLYWLATRVYYQLLKSKPYLVEAIYVCLSLFSWVKLYRWTISSKKDLLGFSSLVFYRLFFFLSQCWRTNCQQQTSDYLYFYFHYNKNHYSSLINFEQHCFIRTMYLPSVNNYSLNSVIATGIFLYNRSENKLYSNNEKDPHWSKIRRTWWNLFSQNGRKHKIKIYVHSSVYNHQ